MEKLDEKARREFEEEIQNSPKSSEALSLRIRRQQTATSLMAHLPTTIALSPSLRHAHAHAHTLTP